MKIPVQKLLVALALFAGVRQAAAQGTTAFTYQGQLRDNGTNANGTYMMIFKLYDAFSAGNQVGSALTNTPALVNGLFTVNLDFGAGAFNGTARYLDITVSNGVAQTLSPRVQVMSDPYAQFAAVAATVTNGAIQNAQLAASAVNANNIASGQVVKSLNGLSDAVSLSAGANVTITPSGNTLQISSSGGGGGGAAIAAGNNVGLFTNSGIVQISSFVPHIQLFHNVTNETFTVPTNVTTIMVEMWGSAGGGGGGGSGSFAGGGGGPGAYAINTFTVTPSANYQVTCGSGAGGGAAGVNGNNGATSSFGALMSADGGSGGQAGTSSSGGSGGAKGTSSGSLGVPSGSSGGPGGSNGGTGTGFGGAVWRGGAGGFPGGFSGSSPGGGGGGGGPASPGGNGGDGVVIVYY